MRYGNAFGAHMILGMQHKAARAFNRPTNINGLVAVEPRRAHFQCFT